MPDIKLDAPQPGAKKRQVSSWPDALTRIAESALLTGNFLPFLAGLILVIIAIRLTPTDLKAILSELVNQTWFCVMGWGVAFLVSFSSIRLFRWKDASHRREIDRMAEVKNIAMQKHFQLELPTSKKEDKKEDEV